MTTLLDRNDYLDDMTHATGATIATGVTRAGVNIIIIDGDVWQLVLEDPVDCAIEDVEWNTHIAGVLEQVHIDTETTPRHDFYGNETHGFDRVETVTVTVDGRDHTLIKTCVNMFSDYDDGCGYHLEPLD